MKIYSFIYLAICMLLSATTVTAQTFREWQDLSANAVNRLPCLLYTSHTNLYSKKGAERFKVFIGFICNVCTNLCVSTDGYLTCLEVTNTNELYRAVLEMFNKYDPCLLYTSTLCWTGLRVRRHISLSTA